MLYDAIWLMYALAIGILLGVGLLGFFPLFSSRLPEDQQGNNPRLIHSDYYHGDLFSSSVE